MPVPKYTIDQFAERIKKKYPQYKDVDNSTLSARIIEKYPEYKNQIQIEQVSAPATHAQNMAAAQSIRDVFERHNRSAEDAQMAIGLSGKKAPIDRTASMEGPLPVESSRSVKATQTKDIGKAKEAGVAMVARVKEDTPKAIVNSAKQYFENNKIKVKDGDLLFQQKVDELNKAHDAGDLSLYYDKLGVPKMGRNMGFWEGILQGFQDATKSSQRASDIMNMSDSEAIEFFNKEQKSADEYLKPQPNGGFGYMIGSGVPLMGRAVTGAVAGGALASLAPETGGITAAGLPTVLSFMATAPMLAESGYTTELEKRYFEGKKEGLSDKEAIEKAKSQALVGEITELAMGAALSKLPVPASPGTGVRNALAQMAKNEVKNIGEQAGISAAASTVKNAAAATQGYDVDLGETMKEAWDFGTDMAKMGAAMFMLTHPTVFPKYVHAQVKEYLSKVSPMDLTAAIEEAVQKRMITPEQGQQATASMDNYANARKGVPNGLPEDKAAALTGLIEKRNNLEKSKEGVDPMFHEDIDTQIKQVDERIKEVKSSPDPLAVEVDDLTGENGSPNVTVIKPEEVANRPEITVIEAQEPARNETKSSASVIMPEANKKPQSVTLKSEENAQTVRSNEGQIQEGGPIPNGSKDKGGENIQLTKEGSAGDAETKQPAGEKVESNVHVERPAVKMSFKGLQEVSTEFGLDDIKSRDRKSDLQLAKDAENTVSKWVQKGEYNKKIESLVSGLEKGTERLSDEGNLILANHVEQLRKELHEAKVSSPEYDTKLEGLQRVIDAAKSGRSEAGAALRVAGTRLPENTLEGYMLRELEASKRLEPNKKKLSASEKAIVEKEFTEINKAEKDLEAARLKISEKAERGAAESEFEAVKKKTRRVKKSAEDFKKERAEIFSQIKEKLKQARSGESGLTAVPVPFAKELVAIAPEVAKLTKSLVEQGVDKLDDVVREIHGVLKDSIDGITEKDVVDVIGGKYRAEKATRNELATKLKDLRDEASLLNQIEAAEAGVPKTAAERKQRSARIEELQAKLKEVRKDKSIAVDAQTDISQGKLPSEQEMAEKQAASSVKAEKTRVQKEIESIQQQLESGDFETVPKNAKLQPDQELVDLRDKLLKLKEDRDIRLMKKEYADRTPTDKAKRIASEVLAVGRVVKSSFDVSMPFRQGAWGLTKELLSLPIGENKGFKSQRNLAGQFKKMYQALGSEKLSRRIMADIHEHPNYDLAQKSGLKLAEPNSRLAIEREDTYGPSLAERIPFLGKPVSVGNGRRIGGLVKASERAATTFINQMKFDIFNQYVEVFKDQKLTFDNAKDLYEAAATYANQIVGRGKLSENVERANAITSRIFFSLRLQASRLQLLTNFLNPSFYKKTPAPIRNAYLKDMMKFVSLGTATLAIASQAGFQVGVNPYGSDFGKIRIGNTQLDIWGGFAQWATFLSRFMAGKKKSSSGEVKDTNRGDLALRFMRSKTSPEMGTLINVLQGKDYLSKETTLSNEALNFITPLMLNDFLEVQKDAGTGRAILMSTLAAHGFGIQTYSNDPKSTPKKKAIRRRSVRKRSED